ncbi:MAG: HEAT repeat domain-containing protein [Synechococcales cyanobacterium RM1_1_8]|nr:HEAT repeat domain-containing protein [Synechococcales cyanobacterium RM1_1_8]
MSTEALFAQLKHPNPNLRSRAIWELAEVYDADTIASLMANLGEDDVVLRRSSVKALGAIGPDAVPSVVEALLHSDSVTVRGSAAKALAQVAVQHSNVPFPQIGLDGLEKAMADDNPVVHIASAMALGEVGLQAVEILIQAVNETENLGLAVSALNALGGIPDERAKAALAAIANDPSKDVYLQETATSALSRQDLVKGFKKS